MTKAIIINILLIFLSVEGCKSLKTVNENKSNDLVKDCNYYVWIYHVSGIQCKVTYFSNLESAVSYLHDNEIATVNSKEFSIYGTCFACGCPSSLNFAAKILYQDLGKAMSCGWTVLQDQ
jgi:hypothetical protein